MAISKYMECLFTFMILHYGCTAYDIDREVCLETLTVFVLGYKACQFTLADAKTWLESDFPETRICSKTCHVKINDLQGRKWGYTPKYQLESLAVHVNDLSENLKIINTRCTNSNEERTLEIDCKAGFVNVDISKDLCTSTEDCETESKTCLHSLIGQNGICICKPGYIEFGNKCLKGNLKLNEKCKQNEQCSVAFGSVCQNDTCVCSRGYVPWNDYECVLSDISKDLCTSIKECEDESKTCSRSLIGQVGICICKPEYIGFGNKCLKGNLKLNEKCKHNEQCSVAFGSVCQNDTCVCSRGYVPWNDSECVLSQSDGKFQASTQDKKENNVGVTVGCVFGGLILGILLSVFAVTIFYRVRHGKTKTKERGCHKVAFFNNTTYETEKDVPQTIPDVHRTNERKVVNVPPFTRSVELPIKRNAQEATKRSMANNDVNNDVYNHLHEKEEDADVDENYDHAHGNPCHAMGESNYSNLNTGGRSKEPDSSEDNDYNVLEPASDY